MSPQFHTEFSQRSTQASIGLGQRGQWFGRGMAIALCFLLILGGAACRSKKKRAAKTSGPRWQATAKTPKSGSTKAPVSPTTPDKRHLKSSEANQVVAEARKYTGTPYRYGGASRAGMDCSGLIMASYAAVGKTIPRPSSEQATCGPDIPQSQAQPGDLIFFGQSPSSISHVGMVTSRGADGVIHFIHSSTTLGVTENKLTDKYWAPRFIKVVRPWVE